MERNELIKLLTNKVKSFPDMGIHINENVGGMELDHINFEEESASLVVGHFLDGELICDDIENRTTKELQDLWEYFATK